MYTILAIIVNLKWYAYKKWTSSLKLVVILAQCRYTKTAQRLFKYSDIQYTSLTLDIILNSLIYRTLVYVNIYGSYKLLKTVRFLAHPLYICFLINIYWHFVVHVLSYRCRRVWKKHNCETNEVSIAYIDVCHCRCKPIKRGSHLLVPLVMFSTFWCILRLMFYVSICACSVCCFGLIKERTNEQTNKETIYVANMYNFKTVSQQLMNDDQASCLLTQKRELQIGHDSLWLHKTIDLICCSSVV